MSEDQKPEGQQQEQTVLPKDWSSDTFPTSARKVFIGWAAMLGGVALLCFVAYATSEHPDEGTPVAKKSNDTLASELEESADE